MALAPIAAPLNQKFSGAIFYLVKHERRFYCYLPLRKPAQNTSIFMVLIVNRLAPIKYFGGRERAGLRRE